MRQSVQQPARFGAAAVKAALLGALLCSASGVRAEQREETKRYQLRWVREGGAESCVSGAALERLLQQVLGAQPVTSGPPLLLEGVAKPAAEPLKYSINLSVRDAKTGEVLGERELLSAESKCSALTPALLLVLAMSVEPDAGKQGLPEAVTEELQRSRDEDVDVWPTAEGTSALPNSAPPPHAEPARVAPTRNGSTSAPEPSLASRNEASRNEASRNEASRNEASRNEASRNEPRVFGALALGVGTFPTLSSGAELGARVALRRRWALTFSVLGWFPQVVALPPSPYLQDEGVQLAAGQVGAALCQPVFGRRLQVGACGGVTAGLRWVSALALGARDNPTRPFYGPTLGVDATFRLALSWLLSGGITAQATFPRDRFTYRDHQGRSPSWFEPPLFSGRAWLGVGALL